MKRMRIVGLALVALVALGIAAGSASAEPVFFGKAEIGKSVANVKFKGTGATAFLEGKTSKLKIECKANSAEGEVTGPTTTAKNLTKFTNCEIAGLALPCETKGAAAKEIVTKNLAGELGGITATLPGTRLKPEEPPYLAEFECASGGVLVKVTGSVIGSMSGATATTVEAGKLATSIKLTLKETAGAQQYTHFLTGPSEQLTSIVSEFNGKEFVTHEELGGQSAIETLTTSPSGQLGLTK
jgi:hypothetical protein